MTSNPLKRRPALALALGLAAAAGCGSGQPRLHPVAGKVTLARGAVADLAGHHVEAALTTDPTVRASGVIRADGGFTLATLRGGTLVPGAREGTYRARILPADEADDGQKLRRPPVAARALRFETSGLEFTVPAAAEVTLAVPPR